MAVKRFITTAPRQEILHSVNGDVVPYKAIGNEKLNYEKSGSYPVLNLLHGYVECGDEVEVLIITAEYEHCLNNFHKIKEEALKICQDNQTAKVEVSKIAVAFNEFSENHLDIFKQLVEHIQEGDRLYACLTYGSKPTPLLEIMALNYGYRTFKDVCIEAIVYGEMDFVTGKKRIYDVTSLFLMDQIVNELGYHNHRNVLAVIQDLLTDTGDVEE